LWLRNDPVSLIKFLFTPDKICDIITVYQLNRSEDIPMKADKYLIKEGKKLT